MRANPEYYNLEFSLCYFNDNLFVKLYRSNKTHWTEHCFSQNLSDLQNNNICILELSKNCSSISTTFPPHPTNHPLAKIPFLCGKNKTSPISVLHIGDICDNMHGALSSGYQASRFGNLSFPSFYYWSLLYTILSSMFCLLSKDQTKQQLKSYIFQGSNGAFNPFIRFLSCSKREANHCSI